MVKVSSKMLVGFETPDLLHLIQVVCLEQVRYASAPASRSSLSLCTAGLTVLTSPSNLMSSHCATDADRLLTGSHILSEIRVEGTFSVAEVHSWISNCLPEMPDRCSNTSETLKHCQMSVRSLRL